MVKPKPCILAVDDEKAVLLLVRRSLESEGYQVTTANCGRTAIAMFEQQPSDLVLLDIVMPDIDGYAVCQHIRSFSSAPIIFLTGKASNGEIVKGLDVGADDYVAKPFSIEEILARVRAALRRSQAISPMPPCNIFRSGGLEVNLPKRRVTVAGNEIKLTPKEFHLLCELALNAGKVLTYSHFLTKFWGPEYRDERQYLHVFIGCLRTKLNTAHQDYGTIENVSGVGYRLSVSPLEMVTSYRTFTQNSHSAYRVTSS